MKKKNVTFSSVFAGLAMIICFVVALSLFMFVMGNPANFEGGDPANHPLPGNYLGIIYKGGYVVPVLMSFLLMTIVFTLERFFTIRSAHGKGSVTAFVAKLKAHLEYDDIDEAVRECDRQKGSIGNVIKSAVLKMDQMRKDTHLSREQKTLAIEKELEDSIALEMPMLNRNLPILATLASIATLVGLFGTVVGMIRAFAALAVAGSPDSTALANGISEALINTALGIGTSAIAIIAYNYFTNKIDTLRYSIDEVGQSIIQTFHTRSLDAPTATSKTTISAH
jgi:biopolymer transport protein ExbB